MTVKLVLDQGIARDAAVRLRDAGIDCIHVAEEHLACAEDPEILEFARVQKATVVTLDADFHMLLAVTRATFPSVIRIRQEGLGADAMATLIQAVLRWFSEDLHKGCIVSVNPGKSRGASSLSRVLDLRSAVSSAMPRNDLKAPVKIS